MDGLSAEEMLKSIARVAEQSIPVNEEDYIGEDGLLVCGKCGNKKQIYIHSKLTESGQPDPTSIMKVKVACECVQRELEAEERRKKKLDDMVSVERLKNLSLMDKKFKKVTFQVLETDKYNSVNMKLCRHYAVDFDDMLEKNQSLLLWGGVGTGKSYAAAAIANYLLERKVPVVMTSLIRLIDEIQSGRESEPEILDKLSKAKLVIFDDLGAERSTDYAIERVYNIIDSRYRSELPMILTTNMSFQEMKAETDQRYTRIYSRIFETCHPMQFVGPDRRLKAASKRYKNLDTI